MGNAPTQGGFADRSVHLLGQRPFAFSMQDLACRNWHRLKETGPTNGICTRSATFTGLNATHTPWPASSVLRGDMRQDLSDAKSAILSDRRELGLVSPQGIAPCSAV